MSRLYMLTLTTFSIGVSLSGMHGIVWAQTQDVQGGPLDPETARAHCRAFLALLNTKIELVDIQPEGSLKECLGRLDEHLGARGIDLPILVDRNSFKEVAPGLNVWAVPVEFAGLPQQTTVAQFLNHALTALPEARIVVRSHGYIEVTTREAVAREGLPSSFQWRITSLFGSNAPPGIVVENDALPALLSAVVICVALGALLYLCRSWRSSETSKSGEA